MFSVTPFHTRDEDGHNFSMVDRGHKSKFVEHDITLNKSAQYLGHLEESHTALPSYTVRWLCITEVYTEKRTAK